MADLIPFPAWRGTIVEIVDARIQFESDGIEVAGFAVDVRDHPKLGDFHVWHGLTFHLADLEAKKMLTLLPGSKLQILCDDYHDGDDDPGGGNEQPLPIAA